MIKKLSLSLLVLSLGLYSVPSFAEGWGEVVDNAASDSGLSSPASNSYTSDGSTPCCPKGAIGIILDKDFSPLVGSAGLISVWRAYMSLDDHLYPSSQGDTSGYMMLGRLGKLALEDVALSTGMVTQHEIFGHGWRAREFNIPVFKYLVRPYSGYTEFQLNKYNQLSPSERIAFTAGGMEADGILAKQLRNRWLDTKSIDEREGHFYLITALDQTLYVMNTRQAGNVDYEDDVQAYVQQLNNWFGKPVLNQRKLRHKERVDFLDPYLWYSLYSMGHYLLDGTQCFEYPMIPIGDYQYLPGFRLALAPYGPEYQFINYVRAPDCTLQITLRYSNTGGKNSQGLILETTRLWTADCLSFDGRFDMWCQPELFTQQAHQATRDVGGAASVVARYRIVNNFELMGQLGYKSTGYMPGEALRRGPIVRAGFFVHL